MTRNQLTRMLKFAIEDSLDLPISIKEEAADNILKILLNLGMLPPILPTQMNRALHNIYCYPNPNMFEEDFLADPKLKAEYERLQAYDLLTTEERKSKRRAALEALNPRRQK